MCAVTNISTRGTLHRIAPYRCNCDTRGSGDGCPLKAYRCSQSLRGGEQYKACRVGDFASGQRSKRAGNVRINIGIDSITDRRGCITRFPRRSAYQTAIEGPAKQKGISDLVPAAMTTLSQAKTRHRPCHSKRSVSRVQSGAGCSCPLLLWRAPTCSCTWDTPSTSESR